MSPRGRGSLRRGSNGEAEVTLFRYSLFIKGPLILDISLIGVNYTVVDGS